MRVIHESGSSNVVWVDWLMDIYKAQRSGNARCRRSGAFLNTTSMLGPAPAREAMWARGDTTVRRIPLRTTFMGRLSGLGFACGVGEKPNFSIRLEQTYLALRSM